MEMVETECKVVVVNEQPEFSACDNNENVSASYFILCEENQSLAGKNICDYKIAGMSILNWVVRVCETQPVILKVPKNHNVLDLIKPYANGSDYSVVFYANTPLLNKGHIKDLLAFVSRKRLNVCKLKKGFVLKNDYISNIDEIYSIDTYDLASNDFFEVTNFDELCYANEMLSKKVINYHRNNCVNFENSSVCNIDATVEIGRESYISSGVSLANHTSILENFKVGTNSAISNSKIGRNVKIGKNVIVEDSVLKDGVCIDSGSVIKGAVIGNNVKIGSNVRVIDSGLKEGCYIQDSAKILGSRLAENVVVGKLSKIVSDKITTILTSGVVIGANCVVIDSKLAENTIVESNYDVILNKKVSKS